MVAWMQNRMMVPSSQKLRWAPASGDVASGQWIRSLGQALRSGKDSVLQPHFLSNPRTSGASEGLLFFCQLQYLQDVVKNVLLVLFQQQQCLYLGGSMRYSGRLTKLFTETKVKSKTFFQWQFMESTRNVTANTKGSFVASGLLPPTKYQTTAARKVIMKASHCKGHEPLFYCKVLGRSNTQIVTVSSSNDRIIKNRQDMSLFGKTVFTNLFRNIHSFAFTIYHVKKKRPIVSSDHRTGKPGTPGS